MTKNDSSSEHNRDALPPGSRLGNIRYSTPHEHHLPGSKLRTRSLLRAIFDSENPEAVAASLPAQSLYLAVRHSGLSTAAELLEIVPHRTIKIMLDLDLWKKDRFDEESLLEWLAVTDATQDLELLRNILRCTDLKLISLIIGKYVTVHTNDEPTEMPPGAEYYTPDKGYTWLHVTAPSSESHFLITRLMALLFDENPDIFYQLLAVAQNATPSIIEEEAYQDRNRRLSEDGFPSYENAEDLHQPLSPGRFEEILRTESASPSLARGSWNLVEPIGAFLWDKPLQDRLAALFNALEDPSDLGVALTFITNSAITFFGSDIASPEAVENIIEQTHGLLAIGLGVAEETTQRSAPELYGTVGLSPIYQLGIFRVVSLRKRALDITSNQLASLYENDRRSFVFVSGLRERVPVLPTWFNDLPPQGTPPHGTTDILSPGHDSEDDTSKIATSFRPCSSLIEVKQAENMLDSICLQLATS